MGLREDAEAAPAVGRDIAAASSHGRLNAAREEERPELIDSGIAADPEAPVHVAWSRVMGEAEFVKKTYSQKLKYAFRGIDAVLNTVGPMLRKHGVIVMPVSTVPAYERVGSKAGGTLSFCKVTVRFVVLGPRGDTLTVLGEDGQQKPLIAEVVGEAFDSGDKASTKAQSVALRTFLINALAIPTGEPERDTEHGVQHELAGPVRPTPAEYAAEILDERTSINRLQQIKSEFDGDARMAHAEVEQLDGQSIELGRLVRRVGAARLAKGE